MGILFQSINTMKTILIIAAVAFFILWLNEMFLRKQYQKKWLEMRDLRIKLELELKECRNAIRTIIK